MTPRFAAAVDPVFACVLELIERVEQGAVEASEISLHRSRIVALLEQAEAHVGAGREWTLAKYALVSWIDEMLIELPWPGRDYWNNHPLEVELFHTRLCSSRFFAEAKAASALAQRDALEVFYDCVILGFRGVYRGLETGAGGAGLVEGADDLQAWARQTELGIRLGGGRPPLAAPERELRGARPLINRSRAVWSWFSALVVTAATVVTWRLLVFEL